MANRSLNRVELIGNLTRDPELRYTPNGTAVCTFGLATSRTWTTSDGEKKEETQFHRIVAWNKLAELAGQILKKGQRVYVEGRLTYRSITDKQGNPKLITEIVLDDFIALSNSRARRAEEEEKKELEIEKEEIKEEKEEESKEEESQEEKGEEEKEEKKEENIEPDDIPF